LLREHSLRAWSAKKEGGRRSRASSVEKRETLCPREARVLPRLKIGVKEEGRGIDTSPM